MTTTIAEYDAESGHDNAMDSSLDKAKDLDCSGKCHKMTHLGLFSCDKRLVHTNVSTRNQGVRFRDVAASSYHYPVWHNTI